MSDENKEVAIAFVKALGAGDVATLKAQMAENIEAIATGTSVLSGTRTYQDLVAATEAIHQISKSGLNPMILNVTAEDDRVSVEWEGNCELVNGERYDNQYSMLFTIRNRKIFKLKEYFCTKLADQKLAPLFG